MSEPRLRDLAEPLAVAAGEALLEEVLPHLRQGAPVLVQTGEGWGLLRPEGALGHPSDCPLSRLSLVDPLCLDPNLSLTEGLRSLAEAGAEAAVLLEAGEPLGWVRRVVLLEAAAGRAGEVLRTFRRGLEAGRILLWSHPYRLLAETGWPEILAHLRFYGPVGEVAGWSPEEVRRASGPFLEALDREVLERFLEGARRLKEGTEERASGLLRVRHREGGWRWLQVLMQLDRTDEEPLLIGLAFDVTAQVALQEKAEERETFFRTLTESALIGIYLVDEARILYVNRAVAELLGYGSPQELVGRPSLSFVHPEDRDRVREALLHRLAGGGGRPPRRIPFRILRRDGSVIHVETLGRRILHRGRPAVLGSLIEVTERVRREQELTLLARVYEALSRRGPGEALSRALEVLGEAFPIDAGGLLLWRSDRSSEILREWVRSEEEPWTDKLLQGLDGLLEGQAGPFLERMAKEGKALTFPNLRRRRAPLLRQLGQAGIGSLALVPLAIREEVRVFLGLVSRRPGACGPELQAVLERLQPTLAAVMEAWLREREVEEVRGEERRRLEALLTYLPDGVLLLDREGRPVLVNPVARELLRLLGAEANGRPLEALAGRSLEALLSERPELGYHELRVEKGGRVIALWPVPIREGPLAGHHLLLLRDVTQERQVQAQVQVQERLAAVGQLAAGVAHDFNNLLSVILGFSEMVLQDPGLPEHLRTPLRTILEQGRRGAQMVRQILDFSRRSVLEPQPLDLVSFLKELVKLWERTLPETIHVRFDYEPGTYWVLADPASLQQALMNLALNARDAMPDGGTLTLLLERWIPRSGDRLPFPRMPRRPWIRIGVRDTGTGIPAEVLPHIFEPFFTTKPPGVGTGLGLAQVYGIVKQHRGYIDVETWPGKGTVFWIYLPALEMEVREVPQGAEAALPRRAGVGRTILLVEDEPAVLEVVRLMLERLGYRVLTARNGEEALQVYQAHAGEVDLVLTDLVMPGMGGRELLRALRERDPQVRGVVMTGYPLGETPEGLKEEGIVAWVQKPLDQEKLALLLEEVLGSGPEREGRRPAPHF